MYKTPLLQIASFKDVMGRVSLQTPFLFMHTTYWISFITKCVSIPQIVLFSLSLVFNSQHL